MNGAVLTWLVSVRGIDFFLSCERSVCNLSIDQNSCEAKERLASGFTFVESAKRKKRGKKGLSLSLSLSIHFSFSLYKNGKGSPLARFQLPSNHTYARPSHGSRLPRLSQDRLGPFGRRVQGRGSSGHAGICVCVIGDAIISSTVLASPGRRLQDEACRGAPGGLQRGAEGLWRELRAGEEGKNERS